LPLADDLTLRIEHLVQVLPEHDRDLTRADSEVSHAVARERVVDRRRHLSWHAPKRFEFLIDLGSERLEEHTLADEHDLTVGVIPRRGTAGLRYLLRVLRQVHCAVTVIDLQ